MIQNPPSNETAPAKLQAVVDYLTGISIASARTALIEWSADDRIKLFIMDYTVEPAVATEVVFDVPLQGITKVSGSTVMLVFTIGDKKYNVQFSRVAMALLAVGGIAGVAMSNAASNDSTLPAWVRMLSQHGVDTKGVKGAAWSFNVAYIVLGVILVGFLLVVFVPAVISGISR